jgi:predicted ABC-type ATPase
MDIELICSIFGSIALIWLFTEWRSRVEAGGHNIPSDLIRRRYERGLFNFFELYSPLADRWIVYDNSQQQQKIAEKPLAQTQVIYNPVIWQRIIPPTN